MGPVKPPDRRGVSVLNPCGFCPQGIFFLAVPDRYGLGAGANSDARTVKVITDIMDIVRVGSDSDREFTYDFFFSSHLSDAKKKIPDKKIFIKLLISSLTPLDVNYPRHRDQERDEGHPHIVSDFGNVLGQFLLEIRLENEILHVEGQI